MLMLLVKYQNYNLMGDLQINPLKGNVSFGSVYYN